MQDFWKWKNKLEVATAFGEDVIDAEKNDYTSQGPGWN